MTEHAKVWAMSNGIQPTNAKPVRKEGCRNVSNAATAREFNLEEVNNKQDLSWIKALNNGSQDTENTTHEGLSVYNSTLRHM